MIIISYMERYVQDGPQRFVFYTYHEFFKFWRDNDKHGVITLVSYSETEMKEDK